MASSQFILLAVHMHVTKENIKLWKIQNKLNTCKSATSLNMFSKMLPQNSATLKKTNQNKKQKTKPVKLSTTYFATL